MVILYHTIVLDGAMPAGYEKKFSSLAQAITSGTERKERNAASVTNVEEAVHLHKFHEADQFALAALENREGLSLACRSFCIRGRQPARMRKNRWVRTLADLLRETNTLMGRLLAEKAENAALLGGRRDSTLRDSARAAKKDFDWPVLAHSVPHRKERAHLTDYLSARRSEPCARNAHEGAHLGQGVLGIAGTRQEERLTESPIYMLAFKERLALNGTPR